MPILLVVGQFTTIAAVSLANVIFCASAITNMAFNIQRRSTVRHGPLIDWDLTLLFGAPMIVGSISGARMLGVCMRYIVAKAILATHAIHAIIIP